MNITRAIAGNTRFHHMKTVLCLTVFNPPLQITIVRSYRAAVFVLHIVTLKLALCSHPDFERSENPMEPMK